jgi:uncharacterized protein DUF3300
VENRPQREARAWLFALAVVAVLAADPLLVEAQQSPAPAATPAPAETPVFAPVTTPARAEYEQPPANNSFTNEELEKLLTPIALYPDPLLAQMLPASAYPSADHPGAALA